MAKLTLEDLDLQVFVPLLQRGGQGHSVQSFYFFQGENH